MEKTKTVLSFGSGEGISFSSKGSGRISSFSFCRGGKEFFYREALLKEAGEIVALEESVWGEGAANEDQIISRMNVFPGSSWVSVSNGKIVGYAVCQYINNLAAGEKLTWEKITDNGGLRESHKPNGKFVYGVNMSVLPEAAFIGVPQDFFNCLVIKDLVFGGKEAFYLGSRIPGFKEFHDKHPEITAEKYVGMRNRNGKLADKELCLYEKLGFSIVKILPDYFYDPESENYGVLVKKTSHTFI